MRPSPEERSILYFFSPLLLSLSSQYENNKQVPTAGSHGGVGEFLFTLFSSCDKAIFFCQLMLFFSNCNARRKLQIGKWKKDKDFFEFAGANFGIETCFIKKNTLRERFQIPFQLPQMTFLLCVWAAAAAAAAAATAAAAFGCSEMKTWDDTSCHDGTVEPA